MPVNEETPCHHLNKFPIKKKKKKKKPSLNCFRRKDIPKKKKKKIYPNIVCLFLKPNLHASAGFSVGTWKIRWSRHDRGVATLRALVKRESVLA